MTAISSTSTLVNKTGSWKYIRPDLSRPRRALQPGLPGRDRHRGVHEPVAGGSHRRGARPAPAARIPCPPRPAASAIIPARRACNRRQFDEARVHPLPSSGCWETRRFSGRPASRAAARGPRASAIVGFGTGRALVRLAPGAARLPGDGLRSRERTRRHAASRHSRYRLPAARPCARDRPHSRAAASRSAAACGSGSTCPGRARRVRCRSSSGPACSTAAPWTFLARNSAAWSRDSLPRGGQRRRAPAARAARARGGRREYRHGLRTDRAAAGDECDCCIGAPRNEMPAIEEIHEAERGGCRR